jgi:hypothetical protein
VILGLSVGHHLDDKDGNCRKQQNVDKAAFVKNKLQDEPNSHEQADSEPHLK